MLVRYKNRNGLGRTLNINGNDLPYIVITHDLTGVLLPPGKITVLSGKDAGVELDPEDRKVGANRRVKIESLVPFNPGNGFSALVTINPALFEAGIAQCASVLHAGDGKEFAVYLTTTKAIDLGELTWFIKLGVME